MREVALHGILDLLEGAHLDLADALPRDAELGRELLKGDRVVRETPRLEDAPLAGVQDRQRLAQRREAVLALLLGDEDLLLARRVVDDPTLPLALALFAQGRVERGVAAEPPVHVDDVLLGHAETGGDE